MESSKSSDFRQRALLVVIFAFAMAYFESAAVVYLQRALDMTPQTIFPLRNQNSLGGLGGVEIGREAATLVMLATVGWIIGKRGLERLAWTAVAFGVWDIGYYFWLWVFIGWPTDLGDFDLLFLLPVPWVGPVLAPVVVSLALIIFGLIVAKRLRTNYSVLAKARHFALLFVGGLVVILSFTIDAADTLHGAIPTTFAWPIFIAGMALAIAGVLPLCRTPFRGS
ncbi:MAG: hypothetical protein Q8K86_11070 [Candidatus Nanopelagicaceae bacterium]|nr:hypothetical protein [Candidatus Nanopelagicaceae bacterium]